MGRNKRFALKPRRGGVLVIVAVALPVMLGMAALAIDLGMLYVARSEAQRTADAAALAGASSFIDYSITDAPNQARQNAWNRAVSYAGMNYVRDRTVNTGETDGEQGNFYVTEEVTVEADLPNATVRVWVQSQNHRTYFARLLGISTAGVSAMAAARVVDAGVAPCVIPIFLPDAPDINDPDFYEPESTGYGSDNRNNYWAPDPPLASPPGGGPPGGVGPPGGGPGGGGPPGGGGDNTLRNYTNDFGRRIPLWPGSGSSGTTDMGWVQGTPHPSNYGFFKLNQSDPSGQSYISDAILGQSCWNVSVGDTVYTTPGARTAVMNDLKTLYNDDPYNTRWDHNGANGPGIVSSNPDGNWRSSSRVMTVALVDPRFPPDEGPHQPVVVRNFASVILEPIPHPPAAGVYPTVRILPVAGAPHSCVGAGCANNVRQLQLIQ